MTGNSVTGPGATSETVRWVSTPSLRAGINVRTGALVGLEHGGWEILDEPRLGRSFQLLMPMPGRRNNVVDGRAQAAPRCEVSGDGTSITATWDGVRSEHGGEHAVIVRATVTAVEDRLVFGMEVDNRSDLVVENVYFPYLGDVRPPQQESELEAFTYHYATARRSRLRPKFDNHPGYYGTDYPTYVYDAMGGTGGAPAAPFALVQDGQTGLYVGVDCPSSELVAWFGELVPGYQDSLDSDAPFRGRSGPLDSTIHFAAVHVPYVLQGQCRAMTPVMLAGFDGDWHAGVDVYLKRRGEWGLRGPRVPAWVQEPHSWLQIHVNSPEDEFRWTFDELPAIATECRESRVAAIQLVGWNDGGQDQNNPSHDAAEQLGGAAAVKQAIADCHRIGVKVVLFTKFTWADRATDRFRRELVREAIKDPYGDYYVHPGYRYQTVTQLLDINTKRLIPMCFASERYLRVCQEEFSKVVDLGADGMLFDEALHHSPALLCFDVDHGHRYGDPVYSHDREFVDLLRKTSDAVAPDFLYACEAAYDWELEVYALSYHRSEDPEHIPLSRYLRADTTFMTAVTGFEDRNMVNQCLLYRYVISYEPYNFKGRLSDFPATVAYGRAMDALRTELREYLWDGEFRDTIGATVVRPDGAPHLPYSVFRGKDGAGYAVVVANYDIASQCTVFVSIDGNKKPLRYRTVEESGWRDARDGVVLQARSAAVVISG